MAARRPRAAAKGGEKTCLLELSSESAAASLDVCLDLARRLRGASSRNDSSLKLQQLSPFLRRPVYDQRSPRRSGLAAGASMLPAVLQPPSSATRLASFSPALRAAAPPDSSKFSSATPWAAVASLPWVQATTAAEMHSSRLPAATAALPRFRRQSKTHEAMESLAPLLPILEDNWPATSCFGVAPFRPRWPWDSEVSRPHMPVCLHLSAVCERSGSGRGRGARGDWRAPRHFCFDGALVSIWSGSDGTQIPRCRPNRSPLSLLRSSCSSAHAAAATQCTARPHRCRREKGGGGSPLPPSCKSDVCISLCGLHSAVCICAQTLEAFGCLSDGKQARVHCDSEGTEEGSTGCEATDIAHSVAAAAAGAQDASQLAAPSGFAAADSAARAAQQFAGQKKNKYLEEIVAGRAREETCCAPSVPFSSLLPLKPQAQRAASPSAPCKQQEEDLEACESRGCMQPREAAAWVAAALFMQSLTAQHHHASSSDHHRSPAEAAALKRRLAGGFRRLLTQTAQHHQQERQHQLSLSLTALKQSSSEDLPPLSPGKLLRVAGLMLCCCCNQVLAAAPSLSCVGLLPPLCPPAPAAAAVVVLEALSLKASRRVLCRGRQLLAEGGKKTAVRCRRVLLLLG